MCSRVLLGIKSKFSLRIFAILGLVIFIQSSPGGVASSFGIDCIVSESNLCVDQLDDGLAAPEATTLRSAVASANSSEGLITNIGFADSLFSAATSQSPAILTLNGTLQITTNVTITGPTDINGTNVLTIVKGSDLSSTFQSGDPLIAVNNSSTEPNQADVSVKIENVNVVVNANTNLNQVDSSGVTAVTGSVISVNPAIDGTTVPTVILENVSIQGAVSESGGSVIKTPGMSRLSIQISQIITPVL